MPSLSTTIRPLRIIALIIAAAATITCGGDSGSGPGDDGDQPITLSISLSASSAIPPDPVGVDGIPADMDVASLYAEVSTTGGAQTVTFLNRRDDGSVYMVAPLNADDPVGGGSVDVRVTDGANVTSNTVPLNVEPLPAATTTIQEIVTKMQALMDSRLALHGRTREELRSLSAASMTTLDYPLFMAQHILDSPDNTNSVRATVDGPVPFFENATIDFDLADRLFSRIGFAEFLDEETAGVDSLSVESGMQALSETIRTSATRARRSALSATACIDQGTLGIDSAPALDNAMSLAQFSARRLDGASGQVLQDIGSAFGVVGVIPDPTTKAIAATMGGVTYVYTLLNTATMNLLPSDFDNSATNYVPNPATLNEDAMPGFWNQFKVTAVSAGWQMDKDILDAIFQLAGFQDMGGIQWFNDIIESELGREVNSYVIGQAINTLIGEVTGGESIIEVCPGTWPDIDCTDQPYSKPTIPSGTSIVQGAEHNTYKPNDVGVSQLKVETDPDHFGGRLAFETKPIEVKGIRVVVSPNQVQAKTSEIMTFDAEVQNADDTSLRWIVPAGFTRIDEVGSSVVVQAPADPWDPAVILTARSLANTGLREGKVDSDPRDGLATISHNDSVAIQIDPGYKCVPNGTKFTFQPIVAGIDEYTVIWKMVSGYGSINQNTGEYTAPSAGQTDDVISAEVEGYPEAIDYANVRVGACTCNYLIDIVGAGSLHAEGGDIAYQFSDFGDDFRVYTFFVMIDDPDIPDNVAVGMSLSPTSDGQVAPAIGETGTYELQLSFINEFNESWTTLDSLSVVTINILQHTDTYMVANINGTIAQGEGPSRTTCIVNGSFRAGRWADNGWPCE